MRKVQKPSKPLDLPGSASRTSSLTKTKDSPRKPSQSIPELSHFYRTHASNKTMSMLKSLCFLLTCHSLTQNRCGVICWHLSVNFTKIRSKTHVVTKSLYIMIWFVCLNKLECLKNVETFQTPTFSPKTCCLRFPNKLCKRIHDVSLRFVGNSSSECLQNVAIFHHRETNQTKLLRSMSIKVPSSEVKKMNSTN